MGGGNFLNQHQIAEYPAYPPLTDDAGLSEKARSGEFLAEKRSAPPAPVAALMLLRTLE